MGKTLAHAASTAAASGIAALAVFAVLGPPRGVIGWLLLVPVAVWPSAGRHV